MVERKNVSPIRSMRNTADNAAYMVSLVTQEEDGKRFILLKVIRAIIGALMPVLFSVMPGLVINELIGLKRLGIIIIYVSALLLAPVLQQAFNTVLDIRAKKDMDRIKIGINKRVFYHSVEMDFENYDYPEYNLLRDRVHSSISKLEDNINSMIGLFTSIISMLALVSVLSALDWWFMLLICAVVLANSAITKLVDMKKYKYDKERNKWNNFNWVYRNSLVYNWNIKDVRLFGMKDLIIGSWAKFTEKENRADEKSFCLSYISAGSSVLFTFAQQAAIYAYIVSRVLSGSMSVGTMTIILSGTALFSASLFSIARNYLQISEQSLYINEVRKFFALPRRQLGTGGRTPFFDRSSVIEFRNVSFKYPGSEVYALKDLSITFRGDEKLCIVGQNGAGKTTFIKLLVRLYFPTEGEILLNGVNIYEYDYVQYQRLFAPVFQDGGAFNFTMGENITLADKWDDERVADVVRESGLEPIIMKQLKRYGTQVGEWLDEEGVNLSAGEEQRFKIARAIYHGGEIYLLDEPTSKLDPLAEYDIYKQFDKMTTDKAAIIITHRLSAVQLADVVAVFKEGSVVEYSTHDELYARNGEYTRMFDRQSEFYQK